MKPRMQTVLLVVATLLVVLYLLVGPGLPGAHGQTAGTGDKAVQAVQAVPIDKDTAYDLQLAFNEYQQMDRDNNVRRAQLEQQLRQAVERDQLELRDLAKAYNELLSKARKAAGVADNCGPNYKKKVWDCQAPGAQPGVPAPAPQAANEQPKPVTPKPIPEKDKDRDKDRDKDKETKK